MQIEWVLLNNAAACCAAAAVMPDPVQRLPCHRAAPGFAPGAHRVVAGQERRLGGEVTVKEVQRHVVAAAAAVGVVVRERHVVVGHHRRPAAVRVAQVLACPPLARRPVLDLYQHKARGVHMFIDV